MSASEVMSGNGTHGHPILRRACEACRAQKVRCDFNPNDPNGACKRCAKVGRSCINAASKRQKRVTGGIAVSGQADIGIGVSRPDANDGIALVPMNTAAVFSREQSMPQSRSKSPGFSNIQQQEPFPISMQDRHHLSYKHADIIDRGILTADLARRIFDSYVKQMAPLMPAVVFPSEITADEVRHKYPLLFLSIVSAGSGISHPDLEQCLTREVMETYATRVMCSGDKSLELVQAIQVSTIWYRPPNHWKDLRFYELTHAAATVAIDIGLGRKSRPQSNHSVQESWNSPDYQPLDPESLEARRAWLVCYFLSSNVAMAKKHQNILQWDSFLNECVCTLETPGGALHSDRVLCQWVRNQRLAEEISQYYSSYSPSASMSFSDLTTQYMLRGFETKLARWSAMIPEDIRCAILDLSKHTVNLYLHEAALQIDINRGDTITPATGDRNGLPSSIQQDRLSSAHIASLSTCITSIHMVFNTFLTFDVDVVCSMPLFHYVNLVHAISTLTQMHLSATAADSELSRFISKSDVRATYFIEKLLNFFRLAASQNKSTRTSQFITLLIMLKTRIQTENPEITHEIDENTVRGGSVSQINWGSSSRNVSLPPQISNNDAARGNNSKPGEGAEISDVQRALDGLEKDDRGKGNGNYWFNNTDLPALAPGLQPDSMAQTFFHHLSDYNGGTSVNQTIPGIDLENIPDDILESTLEIMGNSGAFSTYLWDDLGTLR